MVQNCSLGIRIGTYICFMHLLINLLFKTEQKNDIIHSFHITISQSFLVNEWPVATNSVNYNYSGLFSYFFVLLVHAHTNI